jgi:DNA-binding NarL/FixJ family response regulator
MRQQQDLSRIKAALDSREDLAVIGTGADSYEAIRLMENEYPDIVVIDYQFDDGGLDIIALIKHRSPGTSIILISSRCDGIPALEALSKGVSGYLPRKSDISSLVNVMYAVQTGGYYIPQRIMTQVFQALPKISKAGEFVQKPFPRRIPLFQNTKLNQTELRILKFIGQGKSTSEISEILHLKIGSVRNSISSLMRKSGIHNRLEMAHFVHYGYFKDVKAPQKKSHPAARSMEPKKFLPLLEGRLNQED